MSVLEGTSAALQRKDEVHRLATVNRSVGRSGLTGLVLTLGFAQVEFANEIVVPRVMPGSDLHSTDRPVYATSIR